MLAGVEQAADSVVSEVDDPERDSLDALREVVDGLGRPVGDVGPMPGDDLCSPFADRAAEPADLEGHLLVGKVADDLDDPLGGEVDIGVVVDLADDLFRAVREPHVAVRVTGAQQTGQSFVLGLGEAFAGDRQSTSCARPSGSSRRPR